MHTHLAPCPFCEGPPIPSVVRSIEGGTVLDLHLAADDGAYVKARVFCHECGAVGPAVEDFAYSRADCQELERQAVELWQARSAKNRSLYDGGEAEGLNEYPRRDER